MRTLQLKGSKLFLVIKTERNRESLMMTGLKENKQYSSGTVEGLNRIVKLLTRKAFGFREHETLKIALFHTMGKFLSQNYEAPQI